MTYNKIDHLAQTGILRGCYWPAGEVGVYQLTEYHLFYVSSKSHSTDNHSETVGSHQCWNKRVINPFVFIIWDKLSFEFCICYLCYIITVIILSRQLAQGFESRTGGWGPQAFKKITILRLKTAHWALNFTLDYSSDVLMQTPCFIDTF